MLVGSFFDDYPEVKLLDHVAFLFLIFLGNSILFFTVAAPVSLHSHQLHNGSLFSTFSPTLVIFCLLHNSYSFFFPFFFFFLIYLLIMLLQLSHFPPPSLDSILPTPSLPHSPPIVHVHGSYL